MKEMKIFFILILCLISRFASSSDEGKFYSSEHALQYYMDKNNHHENVYQIEKTDMKILDIDGKGGDDVLIIDPNLCGRLYGCGGGVFLCQGEKKDCSDGYFCEANIDPFYEPKIKVDGSKLKCK